MTIEYNDGSKILPKGSIRISPSQLSKFFDATSQWYRESLLGEEGFTGNTASELGNCVHYLAETYIKDPSSVNFNEINDYINTISNPEVDKDIIRLQYPIMFNSLVDNFLSSYSHIATAETEKYVYTEVLPGIYAAGSIDLYNEKEHGGTISDFKTIGSLDKARIPKVFPRDYYFQQLTYAWILRKLGKPVSKVRLIFITRDNTGRYNDKGKPLKDYPSEVHVVEHAVTDLDMEIIENSIQLIAESVKLWQENPQLRHILAQDQRLKLPTIRKSRLTLK